MRQFGILLLIFFVAVGTKIKAQNVDNLKAINKQVWSKFYLAFDSLDHTLMAEIHSEKLFRIPANQKKILDYSTYIGNYKKNFKRNRENQVNVGISLRFFERLVNDSTASERGIYKFIANKGTDKERAYYGQFHVLLIKENKVWKILMDYDSNENGTIDEQDYKKAFAIDDFEKFK